MHAHHLKQMLEDHALWLKSQGGGRADLRDSDLRGFDLPNADMREVFLRGADLSDSNLRGANFGDAYLGHANLTNCDLRDANFCEANLENAILREADLTNANFQDADLSDTDLRRANLSNANLTGAEFWIANFGGADLSYLPIPLVQNIHQKIFKMVAQPGALDIIRWRNEAKCGTSHGRAGWAITFAGAEGEKLQKLYGAMPTAAMIYAKSAPLLENTPNWLMSEPEAFADMKLLAEIEAEQQS
ncbi:MAG: pentapeptide repeat-containing protein [Rhizobiales bacterium]|nr:pentapeptide repeat-containing protein [Hyphomicrobiales bacterium]